ncbi:MAG: hypothetical protein ACRDNL_16975 [Spirillospora sp.]
MKTDRATAWGRRGRLLRAAPTMFFWYTRRSGILSLLAWVSYGLIPGRAKIWALHRIG